MAVVLAMAGCNKEAGMEATEPPAAAAEAPTEQVEKMADSAQVIGEAFYRERIAVPPATRFEAVLLDVSRQDAAAVELARVVIEDAGQPPYAFALDYDPASIEEARSYAVRAELRHQGELLFTTDTYYPVLTRGAGNEVQLLLRKNASPVVAATAGEAAVDLVGPRWVLRAFGSGVLELDAPQTPELSFASDGRVSGHDGCNRLTGGFDRDGDTLRFKPMAATLMACLKGQEVADQFRQALAQVASVSIHDRQLDMRDESGTVLLSMTAAVD